MCVGLLVAKELGRFMTLLPPEAVLSAEKNGTKNIMRIKFRPYIYNRWDITW